MTQKRYEVPDGKSSSAEFSGSWFGKRVKKTVTKKLYTAWHGERVSVDNFSGSQAEKSVTCRGSLQKHVMWGKMEKGSV